jgi:2-oxoglutarate ferredoxin oxidoreductase subunit alpha
MAIAIHTGMRTDLIVGMAGAGGDGVVAAGEMLLATAARTGYHALMSKSFGSQIRGGESSFRLRVSTGRVLNAGGILDVAVALNWDDFLRFGSELPVGGTTVVIYDADTGVPPERVPLAGVRPADLVAAPIAALAREHGGSERARNTMALGLLSIWLQLPADALLTAIRRRLSAKSLELAERNVSAFEAARDYARARPLAASMALAPPDDAVAPVYLAEGNAMCGAAAIAAGCTFFGGYPITPSTEIMQFLSVELPKYGGTVLQAEDEIAGIGAAIGASFAGEKAMTATSGPGMSLKTEMLGLATIAELPLVCVNVQRGGPSTGIPTKSEQADLFQAVFSSHGDSVRPVLAPTDVADTFALTIEAFNIAEQYQTPVILLSDASIAQRKETVPALDPGAIGLVSRRRPTAKELEGYQRFRITESGVSPISHPGMAGGQYLASGIEHTEAGAPTASGETHALMVEKRARKLQGLRGRRDLFVTSGDRDAPVGLIAWGSLAGVAEEARQAAAAGGLGVKLLVPKLLYPVAEEVFQDFFASVERGLIIEQSHQAQLYRLIRMFVDTPPGLERLSRAGANPITPAEVLDRIRTMALSLQRSRAAGPEPTFG